MATCCRSATLHQQSVASLPAHRYPSSSDSRRPDRQLPPSCRHLLGIFLEQDHPPGGGVLGYRQGERCSGGSGVNVAQGGTFPHLLHLGDLGRHLAHAAHGGEADHGTEAVTAQQHTLGGYGRVLGRGGGGKCGLVGDDSQRSPCRLRGRGVAESRAERHWAFKVLCTLNQQGSVRQGSTLSLRERSPTYLPTYLPMYLPCR